MHIGGWTRHYYISVTRDENNIATWRTSLHNAGDRTEGVFLLCKEAQFTLVSDLREFADSIEKEQKKHGVCVPDTI